jgi:nucleoside-diphosphate-sugar epimerase
VTSALIGHSGFVGGAILRNRSFDACFRSTDIHTIRGRSFDLVVCSGAPAEKWRANRDPDEDRRRLAPLYEALRDVRAQRFILISTIDVYPAPVRVDEDSPIDTDRAAPYGRHRYELEQFCRDQFEATIVRLPGLFGRGLKKNAIFDLLHHRPVDAIPPNARFQFYDVERLWSDVERVLNAGVRVANITSEPVEICDVAREVFGRDLPADPSPTAAHYDVRSRHAGLVGGSGGYWFGCQTILDGIRQFVRLERGQ